MNSAKFRRLYTSPDGVLVRKLIYQLAEHGIAGKIVSGVEGVTSLNFSSFYDLGLNLAGDGYEVELWVLDTDFDKAHKLVRDELNKHWERVAQRSTRSDAGESSES